MSLIARASLRQAAALRRVPGQARFMHGEYKHIPFEYSNKSAFALKTALYLASGFSIPFFAAWYQLKKSSGA